MASKRCAPLSSKIPTRLTAACASRRACSIDRGSRTLAGTAWIGQLCQAAEDGTLGQGGAPRRGFASLAGRGRAPHAVQENPTRRIQSRAYPVSPVRPPLLLLRDTSELSF